MKIKAYFLFPDTDDDFVRIGQNVQSYTDLIGEVAVIKKQLKDQKDFELCYDSENVNAFLSKAEILVGGNYLSKCRTQLQHIFGNNTKNVSASILRKTDCQYFHWNISTVIDNTRIIIAEAAEAKQNEGTDKIVIINIAEAYTNNRENIHVIKDAVHYNELPILVSIPTVNNEIAFSQWVIALSTPNFSLVGNVNFQMTTFKWKKQKIYREKETSHYWYYDYFHDTNKKHFEVFNAQGIHLGEARSTDRRTLDTTKADNQKRIGHIIQ